MEVNVDDIRSLKDINELVVKLSHIQNLDKSIYKLIRDNQGAYHVHSYNADIISRIYNDLVNNNLPSVLFTDYDIYLPKVENSRRIIDYSIAYENFRDLGVSITDVPDISLRSVELIDDITFKNRYGAHRLTEYAMGSKYYLNALRTEENINTVHKCIICTGSFYEIEKLRDLLGNKSISCANISMDVLCISEQSNIEYLFKLILGGTYISLMKSMN